MNTQINHELGNIFDSNTIVNKRMALSKIKSDYINRNKISNDISIDVLAAKRLSDSLCLNLIPEFKGFVHQIGLDTFGFLLFSGIQLKIWEFLREKENNYV